MNETNFQPIFDYIDQSSKDLEQRLRAEMATKADIERVLTAIDSFIKRDGINESEIKAVGHRVDKVDEWITEASPKIGVIYRQ